MTVILTAVPTAIPLRVLFYGGSIVVRTTEVDERLSEGLRIIVPGEAPIPEGGQVRVVEK